MQHRTTWHKEFVQLEIPIVTQQLRKKCTIGTCLEILCVLNIFRCVNTSTSRRTCLVVTNQQRHLDSLLCLIIERMVLKVGL